MKYSFEFDFFRKIRSIEDGITFFDFIIEYDCYEGDHKPSFQIMLILLNVKIFEFMIYNINHS